MSLREQAIQGVFWSAVQNWGGNLFSTVVFVILARLLDARAVGVVALASVFTAFLGIFQRQGFAQAIIQRADLQRVHLDTAFWISAAFGFLLVAALLGAAGPLAGLWDQPELEAVIRWLAVTVFVDALANTPQALLRRNMAFKSLAIRSLASAFVGGIVGVAMATGGCGVWSLVGQRLATSITGTATLWMASRWRPGLHVGRQAFRELFGFGMYSMGSETVTFVNHRTPDLLIGSFLGAEALGFYTAGYRLLLVMTQMFTQTLSGIALPTFSRLQHEPKRMGQALLTATRTTSLIAFPAFTLAAALAPELVVGLMGEQWLASVPIMRILAFIGIVHSVAFFHNPAIMACGRPSWALLLTLGNAVVNVLVFFIAIPWGLPAVAAAYVIRGYLYAPVPLLVVRRLVGISLGVYVRQLIAPALGSAIAVLVAIVLQNLLADVTNLFVSMICAAVAGLITYTLFIQLLAPDRLRQTIEYTRMALPLGSPIDR